MSDTVFVDEPQTIELLQSIRRLMRWLGTVPVDLRRKIVRAMAERDDEVESVVFRMVDVIEHRATTSSERQRALATIADVLRLSPHSEVEYGPPAASQARAVVAIPVSGQDVGQIDSQEADFAVCLRDLMTDKCVTQQELAERIGCSQPAISQLLNRKCRPQKKTIFKLAEALQVRAEELWPDLEVVEMLDALASFEQDDHTMTGAEAKALQDTMHRNSAQIPAQSLPTRSCQRDNG